MLTVEPTAAPRERAAVAAPPAAPGDPKIATRHLTHRALIYVRQSSPTQVLRHPESARRQYGLAERAQRLGWTAEQITIIDEDQGKSGAGSAAAHDRDGFARLVSAVGLGDVGIVLVLEVSRLARNSAEWYRLLELAALAGVLIADEDAVYDPRTFNDRLLLGLRGTISEVELHCIQSRLQGARLSKVRRGELPLILPVGYVRDTDGQIALDPDQEVQGALRTVFEQFARLGNCNAVLRFFRDHGLQLPRRRWGGVDHQQLIWTKPTYQALHLILSNPAYAGAYAYGRRQHTGGGPGGVAGPRRRFALDALEVLLRDHHPAYVSWDQYSANRATLRDNGRQFASSRGAPQLGHALLQGILFCGRCGCRMQPHYSQSSPTYRCASRHKRYGEAVCQSLTIDHVDHAVTETFLTVIRPAALEAALALSDQLGREQAQIERQWQLRRERARYEAERARRQYDHCEPEHRLVARELEQRWNEKLRAVVEVDEAYRLEQERGLVPLSEEEKTFLRTLVSDMPALWHAEATTVADRKQLLRCLIQAVTVDRGAGTKGASGRTTIQIGWRGGTWSELDVPRPGSGDHARTAAVVLRRIGALAQHETDERIAAILNREGQTTRMGLAWTGPRVHQIRAYHGITTACPVMPLGSRVRGDGLVSISAAAERLGVVPTVVNHWRQRGYVQVEQHGPGSPLWVRLTDDDIARLDGSRAAQGDGRWRLREAQHALGLSREAITERLQRGELVAYRAHVGEHWEWRLTPAPDALTPADASAEQHADHLRVAT
ncbi:MAG: recombinase family protein [Chloroflexi bacterium]|nr:recombinase family protein [Chloroflexota bacterium]